MGRATSSDIFLVFMVWMVLWSSSMLLNILMSNWAAVIIPFAGFDVVWSPWLNCFGPYSESNEAHYCNHRAFYRPLLTVPISILGVSGLICCISFILFVILKIMFERSNNFILSMENGITSLKIGLIIALQALAFHTTRLHKVCNLHPFDKSCQ